MWIRKDEVLAYNIAEYIYWPNGRLMNIFLDWTHRVSFLIMLFGNMNYLIKSYYSGSSFRDLALNLSWLSSILFGHYVANSLKSAAKVGRKIWLYIEDNPQFAYSEKRLRYALKLHTLIVKGMGAYLVIANIAGFLFFELQNCDRLVGNVGVCGTVYPSYFIYIDTNQRPYRDIFNLMFAFTISYNSIAVLVSCSFLHLLMIFATDCLNEFKSTLKQLKFTENKLLRRHKLIKVYHLQQYMQKSWDGVAGIFKWPLLVQYLTCVAVVSLILISELNKFDLLSLFHLSIYCFGISICGIFGEVMIQMSEEFKDATFYYIPWDGDVQTAKFLMFMNLYLRKGFELPLGNYAVYTNPQALLVFKMAYSTLTCFMEMEA